MTAIVTVTPNPVLDRTLTVPRIAFDGMIRATASCVDCGGKGFNVSRALQALDVRSVAMGFCGGATGRMLAHALCDAGIETDLVHIAAETRTNVVIAEGGNARYIKVNEAGPSVQAHELVALFDRVRARAGTGDLWVLSGSLPPGVPTDTYARLIDLLQTVGARVLLDASGEPLRLGCAAAPFLVKPNVVEAREILGRAVESTGDALVAAMAFIELGVELVALSMGADGLLMASRAEAIWARPPHVQARNPVGAGDALLAGVAWALVRGLGLEETARWGVAAGTAAALRAGVAVGTRDEVAALYEQVSVERCTGEGRG